MDKKLREVFKKAKYEETGELKNIIWEKITLHDTGIFYTKVVSFSLLSLSSFFAFIPMFKILASDFAKSGFYEYLSLIFSNGGLFSSYWKEFAFSLAESLPTMSILISLTLVFVFFLSLRNVIKQIINNNSMSRTYGIA
jgi:hypothetical protein